MELKTLKDLKLNWRIEDPIKEEAIKWVKDILEKKHMCRGRDLDFHSGRVEMLINFFNISEEDLKGGEEDEM